MAKQNICKRCNKKILKIDKAVLLKTFIGEKDLENVYWHFQCYLDWRDENLESRAKRIYADTMKAIVPQFKNMLSGIVPNEEETNKSSLLQVGTCKPI